MSLKATINNTNTQKDKLKIGKRKIDNKLIELGGEEAVNLAEIPLKMQEMANQYSKIAEISIDQKMKVGSMSYGGEPLKNLIILNNINFIPERILAYYTTNNATASGFVDSKFNTNISNAARGVIATYITNVKKDSFEIWAQQWQENSSNTIVKLSNILLLG